MSTIYISEYARLGGDEDGDRSDYLFDDGTTTHQKATYTGTAGASAAFQDDTRFVRIVCDASAWLAFGAAPTAVTTTGVYVAANTAYIFAVKPGQKVSAVA